MFIRNLLSTWLGTPYFIPGRRLSDAPRKKLLRETGGDRASLLLGDVEMVLCFLYLCLSCALDIVDPLCPPSSCSQSLAVTGTITSTLLVRMQWSISLTSTWNKASKPWNNHDPSIYIKSPRRWTNVPTLSTFSSQTASRSQVEISLCLHCNRPWFPKLYPLRLGFSFHLFFRKGPSIDHLIIAITWFTALLLLIR